MMIHDEVTSKQPPIGRAKGPGDAPHTFLFISPNYGATLKYGEFVFYETMVAEEPQRVYCHIEHYEASHPLPDGFAADPTINPLLVEQVLGVTDSKERLYQFTARVVGFYDQQMASFVNPRIPPKEGEAIYMPDAEQLTAVLNRRPLGTVGAVHIGSLLNRPIDAVPITLDAAKFTSTHLAIFGMTGSGKSHLFARLTEELCLPQVRASTIIVDPHNEHDTLAELMQDPQYAVEGYKPAVRIFKGANLTLDPTALGYEDLVYLLDDLSEPMAYVLRRGYYAMRDKLKEGASWSVQMLVACVTEAAEQAGGQYKRTGNAVAWRLKSMLERQRVFNLEKHQTLQTLCRPGQCSILQLGHLPDRSKEVLVTTLLRQLFYARRATEEGWAKEGDRNYLPYPVFMLVEEAHQFAPASGNSVSVGTFRTVLAEGRKFGVGIGLVTQRPGKLDGDVASQCGTQMLLQLQNPRDQAYVAETVESASRELLVELPSLSKGQAIVSGHAVNTTVIVRVAPRRTTHKAMTKDAPQLWVDSFGG